MSHYEKKLKSKIDDEIKLAGLEALVPEELEKHLILSSDRLRTFEDARLEIVTYVEAKFGLRIREAGPREAVLRASKQSTLLQPAKEKRRRCHMAGASHAAVLTIYATAMHAKARTSNRLTKASRTAHRGPRVRATKENPKENRKVSRDRKTFRRGQRLYERLIRP